MYFSLAVRCGWSAKLFRSRNAFCIRTKFRDVYVNAGVRTVIKLVLPIQFYTVLQSRERVNTLFYFYRNLFRMMVRLFLQTHGTVIFSKNVREIKRRDFKLDVHLIRDNR